MTKFSPLNYSAAVHSVSDWQWHRIGVPVFWHGKFNKWRFTAQQHTKKRALSPPVPHVLCHLREAIKRAICCAIAMKYLFVRVQQSAAISQFLNCVAIFHLWQFIFDESENVLFAENAVKWSITCATVYTIVDDLWPLKESVWIQSFKFTGGEKGQQMWLVD